MLYGGGRVMEEKIYYLPGDLCMIKQMIPNKPTMVVKKKVTKMIRPSADDENKSFLQGIVCY